MEAFSLDAGIATSVCPTIWALRMRISMSAMGSLMLMGALLPACLDHAGHFAAQRELAQLVARETELAEHAARPSGQRATVAQAHRRGIARQLLQLLARLFLRFVRCARVVHDLEQLRAFGLEFFDGLAALLVAQFQCELGHAWSLSA